jgi:hypothetical protein
MLICNRLVNYIIPLRCENAIACISVTQMVLWRSAYKLISTSWQPRAVLRDCLTKFKIIE